MPFLFYRVRTRSLTAPLVATARGGDVEVRNDGDLALPGRLVRFQRQIGVVRVVDPPAPHASVVVGHDFGGPEVARAAVDASLASIGLTHDEAAAFLASWDESFFGHVPGEDMAERAVEHAPVEETPAPEDSLLYFLPESEIDALARLRLDPEPREIHRAMAVWTTIR